MLPANTPRAYNFAVACYGSMWVVFGHSAVLPKKSGKRISGSNSRLSIYARPLPPPHLEKAFDKLPQRILEHIGGLQGSFLELIRDFLSDRQMKTMIIEQMSEWWNVTSGVT